MPGDPSNTKKVAIAVAVIGAIATLGAAFLANSSKSKEVSAPSIQQTASGAGSINVGHDAVINNTKSAGEEAAERVQACEERHGMKSASDKNISHETIPATNVEEEQYVTHIDFHSCVWPTSRFSDGDGFSQIIVRTVKGPGDAEYTGITEADRIVAPCRQLSVGYSLGHQGEFEQEVPFTVDANTIVVRETQKVWISDGSLDFYPDAGEFVVLHNSHYMLALANCVR